MLRKFVVAAVSLLAVAAVGQSRPPLASFEETMAHVSTPIALPDAPSFVEARLKSEAPRQYREILAGDPYQPLTGQQKWDHFLHRSLSSATYLGDVGDTAFTWITGGFMYCCGVGAWGKQYGASVADGESRMFFGNFLLPTLLKQDPRYFPLRQGSFSHRAWYSASRIFIARNDRGEATFNFSEIGGAALSKALSNAYYPDNHRGGWATATNILGMLQGDATSNELREFWPDITRAVRKHCPKSLQAMGRRLPLPGPGSQY